MAFFTSPLDAASVSAVYGAGHTAGQLLSGITRPSGNTAATVSYDAVTGRVSSTTDNNGGTWAMANPTVAGSSQVFVNSVLGASPQGYWRLDDRPRQGPPVPTATASDQVHAGDGRYSYVNLGAGSPFADGTSAASFNGSNSNLALPQNLINGTGSMSLGMWFKSTATNAPLLSYTQSPVTDGTSTAGYVPAVYIGSSGKLHGLFFASSGATEINSSNAVNDGNWHYLVLSYSNAGSGSQTLYLDGTAAGSTTGAVNASGFLYDYVGAGFLGGAWPDETWYGQSTGHAAYFGGTISDVAYYRNALTLQAVQAQYQASQTSNSLITNGGATPVESVNLTDPTGKTLTYSYDPVMGGRLLSRTDGLGYTTRFGYDTGGFLNTTTDPNGNVVTTGHDVRGNQVSRTTCQNQATNACSTSYSTYYPDDTSTTPTADARNDVPLTARDGRSASASDDPPNFWTTSGADMRRILAGATRTPFRK